MVLGHLRKLSPGKVQGTPLKYKEHWQIWVKIQAHSVLSPVALGKSLKLWNLNFLICKMGFQIMIVTLQGLM